MSTSTYTFRRGNSPIVATAIHEGHETREAIRDLFYLTASERLREEDPFTARWVGDFDNSIVVYHSRFETDVNRPPDKAVYVKPEDAWGLQVWKDEPSQQIISDSLGVYNAFYREVKDYFDSLFEQHENILVYDLHSYNHCREGRGIAASAHENPEVNIGTKNINRERWAPVVETLMKNLKSFDYDGRQLDVRENVKFKGGYFGQWLYEQYGTRICPVSIEFKKFFMDEWTGEPFEKDISLIGRMLQRSKEPVLKALEELND